MSILLPTPSLPPRVVEQRIVLAEQDRVPGVPSSTRVNLNKYDFHKTRADDVNPLPTHVSKIVHDAAERRLMALGSYYKYLQVPEEEVKNVEAELRKAKHFEMLSLSRSNRRAELDALRDLLLHNEEERRETSQKILIESQLLRPKAMKCLSLQMEQIRLEEEAKLEEDRRKILVRERNTLLDRRRVFELSNNGGGSSGAGTSQGNSSQTGGAGSGVPVLVMNVALGNGKEEKITVRRHDDPNSIAMQFVKRHGLPDHTVAALANQIRSNVTHHAHVTSGRGVGSSTPNRRTAHSPTASRR
jgi:hypothetical protein